MSERSEVKSLVRTLSVFQGTVLAVSLVVGSGVLGLPGIVLEEIGPKYSALAWAGTALAMIPFIIVFSRLGTSFPSSPGLLSYAEFAFGKTGRNAASLMLLTSLAIGLPALLLIGGAFLQSLVGADATYVPAFAMGILAVSIALNWFGLRTTTAFNSLSVAIVIVFILLLTFLRLDFFLQGVAIGAEAFGGLIHENSEGMKLLWRGAALVFWAFLGWENLSFGVQEVKRPERSVPLIFGFSFLIVTFLFLLPAFICLGGASQGMSSLLGAAGLVSLLEETPLKPLCSLVLFLLILGNANAWVYTASRLLFAEASDGILPRSLAPLSGRNVPTRCLVACFVVVLFCISISWILGFKISSLILLVNQNFLFLFLASIVAYAKVEPKWRRFVVTPLAVITCSLFLSGFNAWIFFPLLLIGLGWLLHLKSQRVLT